MHAEEQHLLRLAEAVADRSPVDWELELEAHPSLRERIENLAVVESIGLTQSSPIDLPLDPDVTGPHLVDPGPEPQPDGTTSSRQPDAADPNSQLETADLGAEDSTRSAFTGIGEGRTWGALELRAKIGQGTFGEVYRAYDPSLQREVALKLPRATDSRYSRRFLSEGRRLARIRHPNVLQVYGAEEHDGRVGVWTDLLEGRTLEECLEDQGPFGAREAAGLGIDLCRALAAVHGAGMIHGDIKTANVVREEGGRIVLLDFSAVTEKPSTGVTGEGATTRGTPIYMAPEQFSGQPATPTSDLYSLGVLLYRLVTNRYPVEADSIEALQDKHAQGAAETLRDMRPDLPSSFITAIDRALAPDPAKRFQTAGEMERALNASIGTGSGEIPVQTAPETGWGKIWLAAAVLAGVALIAWLALRGLGSPPLELEANLYRKGMSADERLAPGAELALGDRLYLEVEADSPIHAYVINEDSAGRRYVLFPLPGLELSNPLSAGQTHRLPGKGKAAPAERTVPAGGEADREEKFWQVSSVGGREIMAIFAAKEPLTDLEAAIADMPLAGSAEAVELDNQHLESLLRGIGGVVAEPVVGEKAGANKLSHLARAIGRSDSGGDLDIWMIELTNPGG